MMHENRAWLLNSSAASYVLTVIPYPCILDAILITAPFDAFLVLYDAVTERQGRPFIVLLGSSQGPNTATALNMRLDYGLTAWARSGNVPPKITFIARQR